MGNAVFKGFKTRSTSTPIELAPLSTSHELNLLDNRVIVPQIAIKAMHDLSHLAPSWCRAYVLSNETQYVALPLHPRWLMELERFKAAVLASPQVQDVTEDVVVWCNSVIVLDAVCMSPSYERR